MKLKTLEIVVLASKVMPGLNDERFGLAYCKRLLQ